MAELTAIRTALIAVFTNLVADQRACSGTADGANGTAENGIADNAASDGAYTRAYLGVGGVRSATTEGKGRSASGRKNNVTDFHGKSPL